MILKTRGGLIGIVWFCQMDIFVLFVTLLWQWLDISLLRSLKPCEKLIRDCKDILIEHHSPVWKQRLDPWVKEFRRALGWLLRHAWIRKTIISIASPLMENIRREILR